jgi:hypothetical protein
MFRSAPTTAGGLLEAHSRAARHGQATSHTTECDRGWEYSRKDTIKMV